jgi:hypothetical protein
MTVFAITDPPPDDKQPIDWAFIEGKLVEWVKLILPQLCGVIWADQEIPQPDYPYVSLKRIAGPTREGGIDDLLTVTDLAQPAGEEIELQTVGPREFTLNVQAHHARPGAGPGTDAVAMVGRLEASLDQERSRAILGAGGLSVIEQLPVTDISAFENATWISRASLDVRFRTTSVMTERVGYIDKVQFTNVVPPPDFTVDAS